MRYLRTMTAACFALLALSLICLWLRSYYHHDALRAPGVFANVGVASNRGVLVFGCLSYALTEPWGWSFHVYPLSVTPNGFAEETFAGFGFVNKRQIRYLFLPHWFLAASSIGLAALLAYKPLRFSIRGLLIATMLLAAVLGLTVYTV